MTRLLKIRTKLTSCVDAAEMTDGGSDWEMRVRQQKKDNNKGSATDGIFQWIGEYIRKQHIGIGDALPSEDYIVQRTGMSRTSVREALTRLRAIGVIDSRRKRGMRLQRSFALLDFTRLLTDNNIPQELYGHMGGFRSALEIGLAPEMFRRATYQDVADLRQIYKEMANREVSQNTWYLLDRKFHERLIQITENKMAIWFWQLLDPYFQYMAPSAMQYPISESNLEKHRSIVTALENRDPYAFLNAIQAHHLHKIAFDHPIYREKKK
ncbi:MAG TPA: FCD domain-containing protein [bacterium]|nr:FCD domain-containing protein [bacterium]HQQ00150.1 FCD domain-containing protein [bacterium]